MQESNAKLVAFKQRLIADMKRDKKRTGLLAVLVVVALVMGARLVANSVPTSVSAASSSTIRVEAVDEPMGAPAVSQTNGNEPLAVSAGNAARGSSPEKPMRPAGGVKIERDLFRADSGYFPLADTSSSNASDAMPTDAQSQEIRRRAIEAQAQALIVEAAIVSDTPTVMMNGRVLTVGGRINGFEVTQITSSGCVVSREGVAVQLDKKQ